MTDQHLQPDAICEGCAEPDEECICWQIEQEAYDPRLLAAFGRHRPPLDLNSLATLCEPSDDGWLLEVIDPTMPAIRVYLDDATGEIYNVPPGVQWA